MAAVLPNSISTSTSLAGEKLCIGSDGADVERNNLERAEDKSKKNTVSTKKLFILLYIFDAIVVLALIIGLWIGITCHNKKDTTTPPTTTEAVANPNLKIYDEALALLEATPLQTKQVSSGEILAYREYHVGQPHTLVVLPGFMADDSMTSIWAVLPELQDHHSESLSAFYTVIASFYSIAVFYSSKLDTFEFISLQCNT